MQAINPRIQQTGPSAKPASGSAFLTGRVVTVTVPPLSISNDMLAIGGGWTTWLVCGEDDTRDIDIASTGRGRPLRPT